MPGHQVAGEAVAAPGKQCAARSRISGQSAAAVNRAGYYEYNPEARDIVVGYTFLSRRCWGGRYNRELKALMLAHAFRFVDRVWFHVGVNNTRSQRAMEKVGARFSHRVTRESGGVTAEFLHYFIDRSPSSAD